MTILAQNVQQLFTALNVAIIKAITNRDFTIHKYDNKFVELRVADVAVSFFICGGAENLSSNAFSTTNNRYISLELDENEKQIVWDILMEEVIAKENKVDKLIEKVKYYA